MKRRALLSGAVVAGTIGLSGCLSGILGTVTSLESTPAGVSQAALDSTGYEAVGIEQIVTEEEVEVAGQSEVIAVTSHLTEYEKRVGIDDIAEQATAIFGVLSTPKLDIAGRTLNPVGEMSAREVVDLIGDSYESVDSIEHVSDETISILDQSTTRSRFVAEADFAGLPIDLDIHVSEAIERGEDLLVSIGVYPRLYRGLEGDNAQTLAEAITAEPATEPETDDGSDDEASTDDSSADSDADTDETDSSSNDSSDDDSGGLLDSL